VSTVLVTGGSGFIGSHTIVQLLAAGHDVRATVRDLKRADAVRTMLRTGGAAAPERVQFFAADLQKDDGWAEAVRGAEYVHHIASPFPAAVPKHEDELIVPAREGTLRVLRAARDAGVKRVVVTSSFAAVGYGHPASHPTFTEKDWTDPNGADVLPYTKSKTLAERAAWDFIAKEGGALELAVVNPVGVFGPVLGADFATTIALIKRMLEGDMPGLPRFYFGAVDVRDVADLHVRAMTHPAAKGERFLAVAGDFFRFRELAIVLQDRLGKAARKVPTRELPDFLIKMVALWDPGAKMVTSELGKSKNASGEKAQRVLGWKPRTREDAVVATAESLIGLGLVKNT
jgi:nucleoside-diphosphate-sugar epimerase